MNNLNKTTPLEVAKKGLELHEHGKTILNALVEIEEHRERTLKEVRKHTARGNKELLAKADANLIILNRKRLEAKNNYKTYILHVGKIIN